MSDTYIALPYSSTAGPLARSFIHNIDGKPVNSQASGLIDPISGNPIAASVGSLSASSGTSALKSINASMLIGPGQSFNLGFARQSTSMQIIYTGNPTSCIVNLEGSLNGIDYFTLTHFSLQNNNLSGDMVFAVLPTIWIRANLKNIIGGVSPTVTAWLCAI